MHIPFTSFVLHAYVLSHPTSFKHDTNYLQLYVFSTFTHRSNDILMNRVNSSDSQLLLHDEAILESSRKYSRRHETKLVRALVWIIHLTTIETHSTSHLQQ
jgi:hypothetical protein